MKITDVKASFHHLVVDVPVFEKPTVSRSFIFCEVNTDEGITGYGVAGGTYLGRSVVTALNKDLKDVVMGMDPRETERIHDAIWWKLNNRAMTGVVTTALAGLDIACWDIHGKKADRTVAQLCGGHRDEAEMYVTFGFPNYDLDQLKEAAKIQVKAGTRRLKMVVSDGTESWREDVARVRAVRDIIGPDRDLMIDANYMTDPHSAKKLCHAIEELDITWFEEPVYAVDSWNMGELRACTKVPISAGQNIPSRWRFRELITNHAIDIAQPNPVWSGFTETVKISHLAQAFNMPVTNGGGWPIINMHNIAGLMNGMWVEFHLGMQALGKEIYSNAPRPENNIIKIPDRPGLGLEPNFDVLNDCIVKD